MITTRGASDSGVRFCSKQSAGRQQSPAAFVGIASHAERVSTMVTQIYTKLYKFCSIQPCNLVTCNSKAVTGKLLDTLVTLQTDSEGLTRSKVLTALGFHFGHICNPAVNEVFDAG